MATSPRSWKVLRELRTVADEMAALREIVVDQQRRLEKLAKKKRFRKG